MENHHFSAGLTGCYPSRLLFSQLYSQYFIDIFYSSSFFSERERASYQRIYICFFSKSFLSAAHFTQYAIQAQHLA